MRYSVISGGQTSGPFTSQQLREMVASGQLSPDDRIRKEGDTKWVPAGKFRGLFDQPGAESEQPEKSSAGKARQSSRIGKTRSKTTGRNNLWIVGAVLGIVVVASAVAIFRFSTSPNPGLVVQSPMAAEPAPIAPATAGGAVPAISESQAVVATPVAEPLRVGVSEEAQPAITQTELAEPKTRSESTTAAESLTHLTQHERDLVEELNRIKDAHTAVPRTFEPIEDLVFLADFEQRELAYVGTESSLKLPLADANYRDGKFGRGYFFERPRMNDFPPGIADAERDMKGFRPVGSAELALVGAETRFGSKALEVRIGATGAGVRAEPTTAHSTDIDRNREQFWTILASAYVKGPKNARITLELTLVDAELPGTSKDKPADPPRRPDQTNLQEIVLTGEWQRVACTAETDKRFADRSCMFSITGQLPETFELLIDGFQLERAAFYPQFNNMPTTWTPGGTYVPYNAVFITSPLKERFPDRKGTIAFWTRTPHESNLTGHGSVFWFSFQKGWETGSQMDTWAFTAGTEELCLNPIPPDVANGGWHHVAMTWDETSASTYFDGGLQKTFEHKYAEKRRISENKTFALGGASREPQSANSVMDEVAVFGACLTADRIRELAHATQPLSESLAPIAFSQPQRLVYYRDETDTSLDLEIRTKQPAQREVSVIWSLGDQLVGESKTKLSQGTAVVKIPFSASAIKPGRYPLRLAASLAKEAYFETTIDIVPALRTDHYFFTTWWTPHSDTLDFRSMCKKLGINAIDLADNIAEDLGRDGFMYSWHYNFGDVNGSPQAVRDIEEQTRREVALRSPFPNWKYTLPNSERLPSIPGEADRKTWFDKFVRDEFGPVPPAKSWQIGTQNVPRAAWFPNPQTADKQGVFKDYPGLRFMRWWYEQGAGLWRIDSAAARQIRQVRPDVCCWTDPIYCLGQLIDLQAGSTWGYGTWAPPLLAGFEHSSAYCRAAGKPFIATLGAHYLSVGEKVQLPDGSTKQLTSTADDLIQQSWLVVTRIPTEGMTYWDLVVMYDGLRNSGAVYCEPDTADRLGNELKRQILPVATMLKGVGNAQRDVALLLPESTLFTVAGQGNWNWNGTDHYPDRWRDWMGRHGFPYDVVVDANIAPGSLAKYKVVIFPEAMFVSDKVHKELQAAARAGTRIVVDTHCRQNYPGMTRLNVTFNGHEQPWYDQEGARQLQELAKAIIGILETRAVGASGPVLWSEREFHGVRYISVLNDHRQKGPYTEWTKIPEFLPYGKEQNATLTFRAPTDAVVYDVTRSQLVPVKRSEQDPPACSCELPLPPHGARVLCVYPRALKEVQIRCDHTLKRSAPVEATLSILDETGMPARGKQLFDVTITDPNGDVHDTSGYYAALDGIATVPIRPAVNDRPGTWKIQVSERTSGLKQTADVQVE